MTATVVSRIILRILFTTLYINLWLISAENALGLCHILSRPCPKPQPQMWDLGPELRDKYEIPRSEIQLIRKLGRGNFGEVFYGKWRNNIDVAVKTLREGTMSTQAFLQEAAIMKKFRHNRLVALYAVCSQVSTSIHICAIITTIHTIH